jgi:threonine dehydrogenase-like Zn-dependent dehydrogenase
MEKKMSIASSIPATMRAAVLTRPAGTGQRVVQEVPTPEPKPGELLVRLSMSGICGSDVHFVLDGTAETAYTPIILGHEPVGVVVARGEGASGPAVGTRVSIVPLVTCMKCRHCLAGRTVLCAERMCLGADCEGAFAEFISVPDRNCLPVPEGLSDELAAVATDSVATAYHAVAFRGGVKAGSRVAVWGTGGLGLSAVGIARTLGAASIIAVDARPEAREWALQTGADEALSPDEGLKRITELGGVDVALEFVGKPVTTEAAVRSLDHGGRAVIVGVGRELLVAGRIMTFVLREREVVGSYGSEPSEVDTCLKLLASGKLVLPRVVGDIIGLDDVAEGLGRVQRGETGGSRIVVDVTRIGS